METTVHVFDQGRDWVEWIVDIGAIVGGLASLLAIVIALIGLRESARLRRASILERRRERLNHRMLLLERIGMEVARLGEAFEARNFELARLHWRQLSVRLQLGNLEDELPLARLLADGGIEGALWDEQAENAIGRVLPEVVDALKQTGDELSAVREPDL